MSTVLTSALLIFFIFFFNDTATTEIYTLSLHDALPISIQTLLLVRKSKSSSVKSKTAEDDFDFRSEERFSRNAETDLVCRLLLEKKKRLTQKTPLWLQMLARLRSHQIIVHSTHVYESIE